MRKPFIIFSLKASVKNVCTFAAVCICVRQWGWEKGHFVLSAVALMLSSYEKQLWFPTLPVLL